MDRRGTVILTRLIWSYRGGAFDRLGPIHFVLDIMDCGCYDLYMNEPKYIIIAEWNKYLEINFWRDRPMVLQ